MQENMLCDKTDIQQVQDAVTAARESYESKSQNSKARKWLTKFSERIMYYSKIMDMLSQHHPEYVALAWGTMKFLVVVRPSVNIKTGQYRSLNSVVVCHKPRRIDCTDIKSLLSDSRRASASKPQNPIISDRADTTGCVDTVCPYHKVYAKGCEMVYRRKIQAHPVKPRYKQFRYKQTLDISNSSTEPMKTP